MDVRIHRCRFCGKEYNYHASGPYCHEATNNDQYCPRCMEIINRSLKAEVPKEDRYVKKIVEIGEDDVVRLLGKDFRERMEELKEPKETGHRSFPRITILIPLPYDNIEAYIIHHVRIYVCWNDGEEERHYHADKLGRMSDHEVVDWYYHYERDGYCPCYNPMVGFRKLNGELVKPIPFGEINEEIDSVLNNIEGIYFPPITSETNDNVK